MIIIRTSPEAEFLPLVIIVLLMTCHSTIICSMAFNVDRSKHSCRQKTTGTKETYSQGLASYLIMSTSRYLCAFIYYDTHLLSLLPPPSQYICALHVLFLNPKPHPSSIPTPSVSDLSPPPLPYSFSLFLTVPKLEIEARHPPRNGDLCSHRDDLK